MVDIFFDVLISYVISNVIIIPLMRKRKNRYCVLEYELSDVGGWLRRAEELPNGRRAKSDL